MTSKRWRMIVSNLAGDTIRHEVLVESPNWMAALRAGRSEIGETGGVPTGSSCQVSPEGTVTILDPMARRRFVLSADTSESFVPPAPKGPSVPPDEVPARQKRAPAKTMAYMPEAEAAPAAEEPKKKVPKRTMAYIPAGVIPEAKAPDDERAAAAPVPEPAKSEPAKPEPAKPAAPEPEPAAPAPPAASPAQPPAAVSPAQPAVEPAGAGFGPTSAPSGVAADASAGGEAGAAWKLHLTRDAEPSKENPLTYRERSYTVAAGTPVETAEQIARERLAAIQESIADRPRGKFINLAIFDHEWSQRPERPPIVTLQFKDWQDSLVVDRPLERVAAAAKVARSQPPPPAVSSERKRSTTDEHDQRLATAFEASQDLLFLSTPLEGLEFALQLFEDLADAEAKTACLYDIDADVYRVAAAQGPGSDAVRGKAIPFQAGLFGAATQTPSAALRVENAASESRFDAAVDGREELEVRDLLYVPLATQGRTLGMIQLINRQHARGFTQADADLATYIGQQLARFLYQARLKGVG